MGAVDPIGPGALLKKTHEYALGHGTLATALAILPLGIGFFLEPWCSSFIVSRLGSRTAAFGMVLEVTGLIFAAVLALNGSTAYLFYLYL